MYSESRQGPSGAYTISSEPTHPPVCGFKVEAFHIGLPLDRIEQVLAAMQLQVEPTQPDYLAGYFNLHGQIVAVLDLRWILGLEHRPMCASDCIVLLRMWGELIGLTVDGVLGVEEVGLASQEGQLLTNLSLTLTGIVEHNGNFLFIYDPELLVKERIEQAFGPMQGLDREGRFRHAS